MKNNPQFPMKIFKSDRFHFKWFTQNNYPKQNHKKFIKEMKMNLGHHAPNYTNLSTFEEIANYLDSSKSMIINDSIRFRFPWFCGNCKWNDHILSIWTGSKMESIYVISDTQNRIVSALVDESSSLQTGDCYTAVYMLDDRHLYVDNCGDVSSVVIIHDTWLYPGKQSRAFVDVTKHVLDANCQIKIATYLQ